MWPDGSRAVWPILSAVSNSVICHLLVLFSAYQPSRVNLTDLVIHSVKVTSTNQVFSGQCLKYKHLLGHRVDVSIALFAPAAITSSSYVALSSFSPRAVSLRVVQKCSTTGNNAKYYIISYRIRPLFSRHSIEELWCDFKTTQHESRLQLSCYCRCY